ncbi:MAG: hypothetical protein DID92_2727743528 [Candidatus Nitrotoga sp. SPKER]|nr:MAG: hypothetical protein DID92_2727743528 [Candidatus Nitrotoga sp. SPKER]
MKFIPDSSARRRESRNKTFRAAENWESDLDLASADLATGIIDIEANPLKKRSWVAYQYAMSPGLKTQLPAVNSYAVGVAPGLDILYTRTVIIVTAIEAPNLSKPSI